MAHKTDPTHHVTETSVGSGPTLPEHGAEPTTDVAWKWLITRLQNDLSRITSPPDGKPKSIGPEWDFVIEKLEKDVTHAMRTASECLRGSSPPTQLQVTNNGCQDSPGLNDRLWPLLIELDDWMSGSGSTVL